jgi:hypothetical protein
MASGLSFATATFWISWAFVVFRHFIDVNIFLRKSAEKREIVAKKS